MPCSACCAGRGPGAGSEAAPRSGGASCGPGVRAHPRPGGRCLFLAGSGGGGSCAARWETGRSLPALPSRDARPAALRERAGFVPLSRPRRPPRGSQPFAALRAEPTKDGVGGNAPLTVSSGLSVLQEVFGPEMCEMSPGDFCLRDGHEGQGFGISLKLLYLHHLQQDADHWRSLWHEGQSGVLPPPFRDSHPGGVPGAFQSLGCSRWEGPGFGSRLCQHFGTALLQWRGDCPEGETQEKKKPGAWSRSGSLQCR